MNDNYFNTSSLKSRGQLSQILCEASLGLTGVSFKVNGHRCKGYPKSANWDDFVNVPKIIIWRAQGVPQ